MTQDTVKALSDDQLSAVIIWAQDEIKARTAKRKQEAIAKIKSLAAEAGVTVSIAGVRGRPTGTKPSNKQAKAS